MTNFCERCNGSGWADASCVRLCDDCNGNGVVDPAKPTLLDELSKLRAEIESLRKQLAAAYPFKPAQEAPTIGYTGVSSAGNLLITAACNVLSFVRILGVIVLQRTVNS